MQPLQSIATDQILAIVVDQLAIAVGQGLDARLMTATLMQPKGTPLDEWLLVEKGSGKALVVSDSAPKGVPWGGFGTGHPDQHRA